MFAVRVSFSLLRKTTGNLLRKKFSAVVSDNVICGAPLLREIPKISLPELILSHTEKFDDKTAVECALTGRNYTYRDVKLKSRNLSKSLRKKLKLREGDAVATLLPNMPENLIAILGITSAGLTLTTLNPAYKPGEICKQLVDADVKAIITLPELVSTAQNALKLAKKTAPIITISNTQGAPTPENTIKFSEFTDEVVDYKEVPIGTDTVAFQPYSSGTTGLPKGVELTHQNLVANLYQMKYGKYGQVVVDTTDGHQDVVPVLLPAYHIFGMVVITLESLLYGAKLVTLPKFTPDACVSLLEKYRPQVLHVAPPLLLFLTDSNKVPAKSLQSLRSVVIGAAPFSHEDEQRFLQKANKYINLLGGYGLSETGVASLLSPQERQAYNPTGSVGKPLENTFIKIAPVEDPGAAPLGANVEGEILVKGPQVMKRYHNRPETTDESFCGEWFRTGDVGRYDDNGLLYITDRIKELIKVKGFQVPPAELEALLRNHPDVTEAAVIGVPHKQHGEVPRAYVVTRDGKRVDGEELKRYVADKVTDYKQLRGGVEFVDSLPKNTTGKILRKNLKQAYISEHS